MSEWQPCPDCGYTEGHTEVCAGFARNDPGNAGLRPKTVITYEMHRALIANLAASEERTEIAERRNLLNPSATEYVEQLEAKLAAAEAQLERYRVALYAIDASDSYGYRDIARQALQEQSE